MTDVTITEVIVTPAPAVPYHVSLSWRYGTSGSFTLLTPSVLVAVDGTLTSPQVITYDEGIDPSIQVRAEYLDCRSPFYYEIYPAP